MPLDPYPDDAEDKADFYEPWELESIGFALDTTKEAARARGLFPNNAHLMSALMEEVGELAKALLDDEGERRVYAEAVQVAAVALRIATEGDKDFATKPKKKDKK